MRRSALLLALSLLALQGLSQSVSIRGRVTDADTKEGLPFSNVFVPGTTSGVSTDIDGYYELRLFTLPDSLAASAIGYRATGRKPGTEQEQTIDFVLSSSELTLDEVVVLAGENPANAIVRNIIENKDQNRIEGLPAVQYESYAKVELDLENIPPRLRESKLMKPFAFVFENIDSTSDEKPFLPMYLNEALAEVYHLEEEKKPKYILKAQRTSGVDNETIIEFIKRIHQDFSIYDDWIYVLEKPFVSPFSGSGLAYYDYYIIDSTYIEDQWSYKLKFKPRRKQENTFFGDFWVADTSFAIQRLNMRMSPDVNINLVNRIIIYQEFGYDQNRWLPARFKMVVDFRAAENAPGMIGRRTESFRNFHIGLPDTRQRYQTSDPDYLQEDLKRDDVFWAEARHEPLTTTEKSIYAIMDSIPKVPVYKTYVQVMETIVNGYLITGPVEFGPYFSLYSNNAVEGHRFRLGIRNSAQLSKVFRVGGHIAYGTRDERFKYGADMQWLISRKPRRLLGGAYRRDISLNSESSEEFEEGDLLSGTFRRNVYQKLIDVEETKLFYERYWKNGFSNRLTLMHRYMDPYGNTTPEGGGFNYAYMTDPGSMSDLDTTISTTEIILKLRYAFEEEFVDTRFERISMGSRFPIIEFQYALGINGLFGGDYSYHKLSLNYRHWFNINPIGWLSYRFELGKLFGTVPFLLMEVHPGNESYFMTRGIFNTMNRYEFASDTYAGLILEHHFDGFIFNKLPGLRRLNLRTVALFKAVTGTISARNFSANRLNTFRPSDITTYTGFRAPERPFMEAGVGIENILKVIRVDALWRLSHLDNPEASRFNVIFGLYFFF